jgi:predicted transcriptional regulator
MLAVGRNVAMDEELKRTPDLEATEVKLLHLLDNMKALTVEDLSEMLGWSVSTVEEHLAKLRAYGLVAPDAQTVYYRLTDHPFNQKLRESWNPGRPGVSR